MIQLLRLRSQAAEQVVAYLRAYNTALAESPVIGSFQRQHRDAGFDLRLDRVRIDLKAETYDAELARREAPDGEALRPFWRAARTDKGEDGRPGERLTLRRSERPLPAPAQPLTRLLSAELPRAIRHGVILGNPGSGKSEALKHQVRLCARQSRRALEEFKALPDMVPLPVYLRGVRLAEKLEDASSLDRCIAELPLMARPAWVTESDWRSALRCAAAILLTVQDDTAFAAACERHAANELWLSLTTPAGSPTMALVAIDGWDEMPPKLQGLLREALRPFARVMAARILVASRLASYVQEDNPLFETTAVRWPDQRELRLCEFDLLDIRRFIDLFFGLVRSEEKPDTALDGPEMAVRRTIGEQLKQALAQAPHLAGVVDNPLMATLLCHDFWFDRQHERKGLPHSRGELFGRILRRIIGKWRHLRTGEAIADWAPWDDVEAKTAQMLDMLAAIAESFFPGELLPARQLADFLYRDAADPAHQGYIRRLDSADPLKRYVAGLSGSLADELCADGILMEVLGAAGRGFGFLHRQFMEYLVAHAWAHRINPPKDARDGSIGDGNWHAMADQIHRLAWSRDYREVIVLLAGLLENVAPLLQLLVDETADDVLCQRTILAAWTLPEINESKYAQLCKGLEQITETILKSAEVELSMADPVYSNNPGVFASALAAIVVAERRSNGGRLLHRLQSGVDRCDEKTLRYLRWVGAAAATPALLETIVRQLERHIAVTAAHVIRALRPGRSPQYRSAMAIVSKGHDWPAMYALGGFDGEDVPADIRSALPALLSNSDRRVRIAAAVAIGNIGAGALTRPVLIRLADMLRDNHDYGDDDDPPGYPRDAAIYALTRIGKRTPDPEFFCFLADLARDTNPVVSVAGAEIFDSIGADAIRLNEKLMAAVQELLGGPSRDRAMIGLRLIKALGSHAVSSELLTQVVRLLSNTDWGVVREALRSLAAIGQTAGTPEVLAQLGRLLVAIDQDVRCEALRAVGAIGMTTADSEISKLVFEALGDGDLPVKFAALECVGGLGPNALNVKPDVRPIIAQLLTDGHAGVQAAAAETAGRLGALAATPEILAALARQLAQLRAEVELGPRGFSQMAVWALAQLGWEAAGSTLLTALPHLSDNQRSLAILKILPRWPVARLFGRGSNWTFTSVADLVSGAPPAKA